MFIILSAVLALIAYYIYKLYQRVAIYPRGPRPLPLIGNLLQFNPSRLHAYLEESSKEFGDVFTVWTPRPTIILTSYASIREALVTRGDDFAGRMRSFPDDMWMTTENGGVIFSDGENWKEQRKVAIQILRDFGMGKNLMEQQVQSSLHEFMRQLDAIEDKSAVHFRRPLQILVANVINQVMFGYHYQFDDCKRLMDYAERLNYQLENQFKSPLIFLAAQIPVITKLPIIGWHAAGKHRAIHATLPDHVREDVARCQKTFDEHEEPQCFKHAYMPDGQEEWRGRTDVRDYRTAWNDQLINVCNDFYMAGMETAATTLRWAMVLMADNMEAQDQIRAEIHSVIGKDHEVTMADRVMLPYTMAAIAEVQRVANILPLNVMHKTLVDTEVGGHFIPANTLCLPQISSVMRDPEVFENPNEFRPERFLLKDGKTMNKAALERVVAFSLGKRQCAGEGLARMELFLGLVSILQKYRILPPKDGCVDLTPTDALISTPATNYLQMVPV